MQKHTVCRMCSSCCPVVAEVEDGKLLSARRKSQLGPKEGFVCAKLKVAPEVVYSETRITTPLIRNPESGEMEEASWDQALDLVAAKFDAAKKGSGPESVAWLRGMAADWGAPWDYANRLMNCYGSPNTIGNGSICFVAREMAHSYTYGSMSYPEPAAANCIMVWGKHDANTALGMAEAIAKGHSKGAPLIVIDPIQTSLASQADIWLQIKPGHDGILAMAMIHTIIEEELYDHDFIEKQSIGFPELCKSAAQFVPEDLAGHIWLQPEEIRKAARLYATSSPACIIDGNGLDMQIDMFQTTRAVAILRGLCGNIDRHGGDVLPQPIEVLNIQRQDALAPDCEAITSAYPLFDTFHHTWGRQVQSCVVDAILDKKPYPIEMVVVQAGNPLVTMADSTRVHQAFSDLNFLVVIDMFMTRTAQLADVFLPASSCFEKTQLNRASIRNNPIILQDQVIEPLGASWPDWKIVFELGRRIGLAKEFPWQSAEEAIDFQLSPTGIRVSDLRDQAKGTRLEDIRYQKYQEQGFATPSGKFTFSSSTLAENGFDPVPYLSGFPKDLIGFEDQKEDFPLIGISGARDIRYTNSQYRNIPSLLQDGVGCSVNIHPVDAKELRIGNKDLVSIESPKGTIQMMARIGKMVHPGSIRIAWGWGEYQAEAGTNILTDGDRKNPITGTPAMRSFRCRIRKAPLAQK